MEEEEESSWQIDYCQAFVTILFYITCYLGPLFVLPRYMVPEERWYIKSNIAIGQLDPLVHLFGWFHEGEQVEFYLGFRQLFMICAFLSAKILDVVGL